MRRREFIAVIGGLAAWPLAARAQQQALKAARLGYLAPASNPDLQQALLGGLRDLGYVEGQNLAIEYRFMLGQAKSYDELAAEIAGLAPDAIVVVGTPPALAAKRQTTTIPIIMAPAADPLRSGLVASLSRPGGNVTGVSLYGSEIARKRMEIFKEAVVGIQRIAVLAMTKIHCIASYGTTSSRLVLHSDCNFVCSSFRTSTSSRRCSPP